MTNNQLFSKEHLWFIQDDCELLFVGLSGLLLDFYPIDFLEIKPTGSIVSADSALGVLETEKSTIEISLPFAARIEDIRNFSSEELKSMSSKDLENIWICKIKPLDSDWRNNLMDKGTYEQFSS